jgi:hypothetical protein
MKDKSGRCLEESNSGIIEAMSRNLPGYNEKPEKP